MQKKSKITKNRLHPIRFVYRTLFIFRYLAFFLHMAVLSRFTGLTLATREQLAQQTAAFFARGLEGAANTQRAYRSDLNQLRQWLAARDLGELPLASATLAAYLADEATRHAWATLSRRMAAIRKWHKLNQHPDPALEDTVQTVLEGIKRTLGTEPGQAPPSRSKNLRRRSASFRPRPPVCATAPCCW